MRDSVGVLDLPGFSRYRLEGPGAAEWLRGLCTGGIPKVGRIGLLYFSDNRGRIVTEMSAMRLGEDDFNLITAALGEWHDLEWLVKNKPESAEFTLKNVSDQFSCQIVSGPKSRELLAGLTDADLTQPWLSHQEATVAGVKARLVRVSFAGELGWEVHSAIADSGTVYDALIDGGATPFGMFALNSLRVEKGYRAWKGDLSTDYSLLEGGLDRFIKFDKPQDFPGKAALLSEKQRGVTKRFVTLKVDANGADAPYMSTLWKGEDVVGETTSGAWGYRVNASIALGMLRDRSGRAGNRDRGGDLW